MSKAGTQLYYEQPVNSSHHTHKQNLSPCQVYSVLVWKLGPYQGDPDIPQGHAGWYLAFWCHLSTSDAMRPLSPRYLSLIFLTGEFVFSTGHINGWFQVNLRDIWKPGSEIFKHELPRNGNKRFWHDATAIRSCSLQLIQEIDSLLDFIQDILTDVLSLNLQGLRLMFPEGHMCTSPSSVLLSASLSQCFPALKFHMCPLVSAVCPLF